MKTVFNHGPSKDACRVIIYGSRTISVGPAASAVLLVPGNSEQIGYGNLAQALMQPDTDLRLFGKPEVQGERRMGVALALGDNVDHAKQKALDVIAKIKVDVL